MPAVRVTTWRREPALTLDAGAMTATFLPGLSMLGVSLTYEGEELLAPIAPLATVHTGHTTGIPLLHPWANRLAAHRYRSPGARADITIPRDVPHDGNGLPMHGTVLGLPFAIDRLDHDDRRARLTARFDAGDNTRVMASFPFPHVLVVTATVAPPATLTIETVLRPTARRAVPAAFGWHPYLLLPGTPRARWQLRLPPRRRAELDARGLPTGAWHREPEFAGPVANQTFDDHYALGRDRRFVLATPGCTLTLDFGRGYPYAQVYTPPAKPFACIEPMAAPVNALVSGTAPLVPRERPLRSTFSITAR